MTNQGMDNETLFECPHCQCHWGIEEIDWQTCDMCGWPDVDAQYDDTYDDYDDEPSTYWVNVDPPYDDNPF